MDDSGYFVTIKEWESESDDDQQIKQTAKKFEKGPEQIPLTTPASASDIQMRRNRVSEVSNTNIISSTSGANKIKDEDGHMASNIQKRKLSTSETPTKGKRRNKNFTPPPGQRKITDMFKRNKQ